MLGRTDGKQSTKYPGVRLQHPAFSIVRQASSKTEAKARYDDLRTQATYSELPNVRSAEQALVNLAAFEEQHPDSCEWLRDDGSFFGFSGVGKGYLGRFTRFLLIPAVQDASDDAAEGRGSPFTELLDLNVRGTLAGHPEVQEFRQDVGQRYRELMDPIAAAALSQLEEGLNAGMQSLVPDGGVELTRDDVIDFNFPLPLVKAKLREHGYATPITNAGHGLQRAFILTMLQTLADTKARLATSLREADSISESLELPDLVLAIEEPELYQHPNRQRHFAKILYDLAHNPFPGVAQRTQVIHTTHSPHFVGIDRYEHVRLCHKVDGSLNMPRVTR
ncbi:MAG: AAA family ATPase, partial [Thermomicrobiales bacterium]|nr:AAA family ATPase [Thermomicrobiales bacterium]